MKPGALYLPYRCRVLRFGPSTTFSGLIRGAGFVVEYRDTNQCPYGLPALAEMKGEEKMEEKNRIQITYFQKIYYFSKKYLFLLECQSYREPD